GQDRRRHVGDEHLVLVEVDAMLLREREGERLAREVAAVDEDLAEAAVGPLLLLGQRLTEGDGRDEPALHEQPAERAPALRWKSRLLEWLGALRRLELELVAVRGTELDAVLPGKRLSERDPRHGAARNQDLSEQPAGTPLLRERGFEIGGRD